MASADRACRRARGEFDAYLDGELPQRRVHNLEQHLAVCKPCRRLLAERRREFGALGDLPLRTAPDDFTERVMAGLADRPTRAARPAPRLRPRLAFAAAAVVLAALGLWLWAALRTPEAPSVVRRPPGIRHEMPPRQPPTVEKLPQPVAPIEVKEGPKSPATDVAPKKQPRAPRRDVRPAPAPKPEPEGIEEEPEEKSVDPIAIADYRQLGEAYEREGMLEEALEAYQVAAADEVSPMATIAVARVRDKMGDTVSAIEMYAEAAFSAFDVILEGEGSET